MEPARITDFSTTTSMCEIKACERVRLMHWMLNLSRKVKASLVSKQVTLRTTVGYSRRSERKLTHQAGASSVWSWFTPPKKVRMTVMELFFRVPTRLGVVQDGATKIQEDLTVFTLVIKGLIRKQIPAPGAELVTLVPVFLA